ncbi:unnamed protein product [Calypogeia fissa]
MAAGSGGLVVLLVMGMVVMMTMMPRAKAWSVSCSNPASQCYGVLQTCPQTCVNWCRVDCTSCLVQCACDQPGAVCQDPRFIGGDGVMFYFHGEKDKDFCIVSDPSLHINAHFIGKRGFGMSRDFTWVQSIGILFGSHQVYLGAKTTRVWDNHVDALYLSYNGEPLILPPRESATWELPSAGLKIIRTQGKNAISVEVAQSFKVEAIVVPITKQESRIHNYNITSDNCFAHLELHFQFYNLSTEVTGVLGQTYVHGYKSPVKRGVPMPIMGGEHRFRSSSLMQPDCAVSKFGAVPSSVEIIREAIPVTCDGNSKSGRGFVCRR